MALSLGELQDKVLAQKDIIPSLYGDIDFSKSPERFTDDSLVDSTLPKKLARKYRGRILKDQERVERARAYTMLGDTVADAYAALMPEYGFRRLIDMLKQACDEGVESVEGAPPELLNFITAMEVIPDWVDMKLVAEGARISRNQMANLAPFAIRGAFIATFMNKYSGLPMALTGALSGEASVQRVNETASFFTTATLPGALERYGVAFKAAAMVRLMHSMVRFNLLKRSQGWDVEVYGIPIPQVDQMPAGTIPAFLTAFNVMLRRKNKKFTNDERAIVELCRYQSYLLGLPEDLLPSKPDEIVDVMLTYAATLRDAYDDETCGKLVRATMSAYRPKDRKLKSRIYNEVETSFSKVFFYQVFLRNGNRHLAEKMGVQASLKDYFNFALANIYIMPQLAGHKVAAHIPLANKIADRILVKKIYRLLGEYGHAEYATDADNYSKSKKAQSTGF